MACGGTKTERDRPMQFVWGVLTGICGSLVCWIASRLYDRFCDRVRLSGDLSAVVSWKFSGGRGFRLKVRNSGRRTAQIEEVRLVAQDADRGPNQNIRLLFVPEELVALERDDSAEYVLVPPAEVLEAMLAFSSNRIFVDGLLSTGKTVELVGETETGEEVQKLFQVPKRLVKQAIEKHFEISGDVHCGITGL